MLPFLSAGLPALGGRIKDKPEHFLVEEIALYPPAGQGPHLYLTLRRSGLTTRQVAGELAARYGRPAGDIGYAGLKDKAAVTTQTFSLPLDLSDEEALEKSRGAPWQIVSVNRHHNKLKVGHLLGNRFIIVLSEPNGGLAEALAVADYLRRHGVPNYFGEQRFGRDGDNAQAGLNLLKSGQRANGWRAKFLLSALQSDIYNRYLALRIEAGLLETILTGDICKKYTTGGLFVSEDGALETKRLEAGELASTGPIFGAKMKAASGPAAELEARALAELQLNLAEVSRAGTGDRRLNRLLLPDLAINPDGEALVFTFTLPKGAYATSVMREFIK